MDDFTKFSDLTSSVVGATFPSDVIKNPGASHWLKILCEVEQIPKGWGRRIWIEALAAKYGTSFQSIYRKIVKYNTHGLSGLVHTKSNREKPKAWSPEAVDWWLGLCLRRQHRRMNRHALYAVLVEEAVRRKWRIGSYRSALWWIKRRVSPQLLAIQRGGIRALDNILPPILRDYSDLAPFQILVGDQHKFNFWVVDEETGDPFRLEGYFWQCARTRCLYGAAFGRRYDSNLMGIALRMGIKVFGAFQSFYTDSGRPEISLYIESIRKGLQSLALNAEDETEIPVEFGEIDGEELNPCTLTPGSHIRAVIKNAKAKLIERTFGVIEDILTSVLKVPGHVKALTGSRESQDIDEAEKHRLLKAGRLLGTRDFIKQVFAAMDYYNRDRHHRGVLAEWSWKPKPSKTTPADCLRMCCADGWRPSKIDEDAVDLVFLARGSKSRKVFQGMIRVDKRLYTHEALVEMTGKRIEYRFDPMDPTWVLVFDGERFVCRASPVERSSMLNKVLASRKIEEKARLRNTFTDQYRQLTSPIPDITSYSIPMTKCVTDAVKKLKSERPSHLAVDPEVRDMTAEVRLLENRVIKTNMTQKLVQKRPVYFLFLRDRYAWIVQFEASGGKVSAEDKAFKEAFESGFSPGEREYWSAVEQAERVS